MEKPLKPYSTITDYITGDPVPDVGAESNRQAVERILVEEKHYARSDIAVDTAVALKVAGKPYQGRVDLVVSVEGKQFMVLKCAAGSLQSWERGTIAAARVLNGTYQIPLSVVSDGKTAIVLDTLSGRKIGEGVEAIPVKAEAVLRLKGAEPVALDERRREREKLIFRSYDLDNVNRLWATES